MFAAHFAAGLTIGAHARRTPMALLFAGAFLPDLVWIGLATVGVEPSAPAVFFDGWSHSLVSTLVEATVFAPLCSIKQRQVFVPVWLAVMSHAMLDAIIHPRPIELYPHASLHLPWDLWQWGSQPGPLGASHYWWVQFAIVLALLGSYAMVAMRPSSRLLVPRNLAFASVLLVLGLHLIF